MRKSVEFKWKAQQSAFKELIQLLIEKPVLRFLVLRFTNFGKVFEVQTDASGIGLGAVLSQDNQPISYISARP